ncbi:conserved membrane hypothetical protein [Frankia canadensis]|uniref:Integral membrane protein n=1 Tax=Frankia canadensis TaxID=1836972 RepID=A0A2I2KQ35_9ACTN|nr:hypothetical protein [Frankia canadensis]SNQ47783.1 conserved membrane hypothetical protein [Frankia canadensis]SOU55073.1 conserved membrane hypothetical protein [Frankia canadensis]
MADEARQDNVTRDARRAIMIDGIPVSLLGMIALALGSSPDPSSAEKGWWLGVTGAFTLSVAWVLVRAFSRADEYQRKIQLESMAIAFAAVLVGLQAAVLLDATDIIGLRPLSEAIVLGGVGIWFTIADLRTRLHR